jgi:HAD superfamily hydrolase (TIGR01509 family)
MRASPPRWEAVIFDCDGVLLDTEKCWTRAEEALFASYGRDFTPEHKRSLVGTGGELAAELLASMLELPGRGGALLSELHRLARREFAAAASATRGAIELLHELTVEFRIGLASNTPRELVKIGLRRAEVDAGLFDTIVCADEVRRPKPAPDVYERACSRLGVNAYRTVVIEDSPSGVAAARAAGMAVVGLVSTPGVELSADWVVPTLADPELRTVLGLDRTLQKPV